ncbi:MAG: hypothetical protein HYZ14_16210 [Bacteroidetes bacterium]|nr:hypothetical protein [Bacteroidota bacterium]
MVQYLYSKVLFVFLIIQIFQSCKNSNLTTSNKIEAYSIKDSTIGINLEIDNERFLIDSITNTLSSGNNGEERTFNTNVYFTKDFNRKEEGKLFYYEIEYSANPGKYCFSELGQYVVPRAYFHASTKFDRTETHRIDDSCQKEWLNVINVDSNKKTVSFELMTHYNKTISSPDETVNLKIENLPFNCILK